jgi:hypothetical protein
MQTRLQAGNDSDAAQADSARPVAQMRYLSDARSEAMAQGRLADMKNDSPRVSRQRALGDTINDSPRMVAQRHAMNALFRGAPEAHGDGAMPAEASPAGRGEKTSLSDRSKSGTPRHEAGDTGLPAQLKAGIESLSGMSMDHVRVHYNSAQPARLQAHAYAQGSDIHLGPGQERHLPHEAWHVVQQAQGRVRPTLQMARQKQTAVAINDDAALEREADTMGDRAAGLGPLTEGRAAADASGPAQSSAPSGVAQRNLDKDTLPSYAVAAEDQENESTLIHRGLVETEMVSGKKYVRAYQTVYADVETGSWKDTHQTVADRPEDQKIVFRGKGDTWINFGNPLRALHYVRTYHAQAPGKRDEDIAKLSPDDQAGRDAADRYHGRPIVRSFLVPFAAYQELTGTAISESQRGKLGKYNMNVDKSKSPDQYQIMAAGVHTLRNTALPGSLVSYVMDHLVQEYAQNKRHGEARSVKELSEKLGLPDVFDPLTIPMKGTEVPSPEEQDTYAQELGELYDLSFFAESQTDHPRYAGKPVTEVAYSKVVSEKMSRMSELLLKHKKTAVLPGSKAERDVLRKQLAAAANAAAIPKMIEDNYLEGAKSMHKANEPATASSTAADGPRFKKLLLTPKAIAPAKKGPPSAEEIKKKQDAARLAREANKTKEAPDDNLFEGLLP